MAKAMDYFETLLELGLDLCPTDYAVHYFAHPAHPKWFANDTELLKAVRRAAPNRPRRYRLSALSRLDSVCASQRFDSDEFKKVILGIESLLVQRLSSMRKEDVFDLFSQADLFDDQNADLSSISGMLFGKHAHAGVAWIAEAVATVSSEKFSDMVALCSEYRAAIHNNIQSPIYPKRLKDCWLPTQPEHRTEG
jgi:hypothetical protein